MPRLTLLNIKAKVKIFPMAMLILAILFAVSCSPEQNPQTNITSEEIGQWLNQRQTSDASGNWTFLESLNTGKISASATANSITLTWDAVSQAEEYLLVRWNFATSAWGLLGLAKAPTYTDNNLNSGTTYRYVVMPLLRSNFEYGFSAGPVDQATSGSSSSSATFADLGFRPTVHGFGFENYGGNAGITNLTSVEMRRLFGDQVCGSLSGGTCILTPPAQQWMESNNSSMSGGHCEGFAALSLLMYSGKISPATFGGTNVVDLILSQNTLLQREIAYWFVTQSTSPARNGIIKGTPKDIVNRLLSAYANGANSSDTYAVGIYKSDMTGGHAVTAYGVEQIESAKYNILIYDNNYPKETRKILVDTSADTWQYEAAINPSVAPDLYTGNATTQTLEIVPTSSRLGQQSCTFCSSDANSSRILAADNATKYNEIWMRGNVAQLIKDSSGRNLGYVNGLFVNQIPGAQFARVKGIEFAKQDVAPTFFMPKGTEFTVVLDGDTIKAREGEDTEISMIGPGYYLGVQGTYMEPGQKDTLNLSADAKTITYSSTFSESPVIIVGIERSAADFEVELQANSVASGSQVIASIDASTGILSFKSSASTATTFYLAASRISDDGEQTFESGTNAISLVAKDVAYVNLANWPGQGSSMTVAVDTLGDGTLDRFITLTDAK